MTPSELICLSGIALPPAIVPSRYIQGRGAKLRTWRDKFTALLIKLGHCEIQIRPLGVKTGQRLTDDRETRTFCGRGRAGPRPISPVRPLPYRRFEIGFDLDRAGVMGISDSDQIPKLTISIGCCRLNWMARSTGTTFMLEN